ncbi:helix-turn-helix domain-containing protein, partial [Candidatus Woesearchaeota archaeon]|nr:helix-turn-helix domain-containing protein [Candidatus Woesearchaeota archaeon]
MPKRPKLPEGYSPNRPVEATPVGMDELIKKLSSMPDMPDQEFFGIRETAQLLGVQYNTVLKLIMNSGIRAYKIGGQWKITKNDFRGYLEQHSNQRGEPESARPESPLEALLHDLDANDPEDYRFRQELDSYIADRLSEVSQMHPLWKKRYTKRVVSEEVNTLLEGRFGVLDDSIGTGSSTQRGKPESALPKLL